LSDITNIVNNEKDTQNVAKDTEENSITQAGKPRAAGLILDENFSTLKVEVADESAVSDSIDRESDVQKITAYSVLPGLPPIHTMALPAMLPLPGSSGSQTKGYPSLPPGLEAWQDEERSPVFVMNSAATTPMASPQVFGQVSSSPHGAGLLFATVPWLQSAPQSLASSPTSQSATQSTAASPTSTTAKGKLLTIPVEPIAGTAKESWPKLQSATPFTAAPPTSTTAEENTLTEVVEPIAVTTKETCSSGTQTEDCSDMLCPGCRVAWLPGATKRAAALGGA